MNYIKQLKQHLDETQLTLAQVKIELESFRTYILTAPKFVGVDLDGGRKDWISTGDVAAHLEIIRSIIVERSGR